MSQKPSFLALAVALIALGVSVYALTQATVTPPVESAPRGALDDALLDFEKRLAALEAARRTADDSPDATARLLERLDDLDRRLQTLVAASEASPSTSEAPPPETAPRVADLEPDAEEVERFRKLQAAASRQRRDRRNRTLMEDVLAANRIVLTDDQKAKLVEAMGAFESRRNEIWGEAKRRGAEAGEAVDWSIVIEETNRVIVREFAERISAFVSGGDAELISRSLSLGGK